MSDSPDTLTQTLPRRRRRWTALYVVPIAIVVSAVAYFGIGVRVAREQAHSSVCRGRMSQLTMALHTYHDTYGSFPPAYIVDADGKPMHSWRVLILPFLNEGAVYKQYRFDEPWNSPHNRELAQRVQNQKWHCPTGPQQDDSAFTDYVVVVGSKTAFPGQTCTSLSSISDGPENSLLLVEIANSGIHWMEPRDLSIDQMSFQVNDRTRPSISSPHPSGPAVVFADGITAYRLKPSLRRQTLQAFATISGGEPVSRDKVVQPDPHFPYYLGE